jgi:hypothetical protein
LSKVSPSGISQATQQTVSQVVKDALSKMEMDPQTVSEQNADIQSRMNDLALSEKVHKEKMWPGRKRSILLNSKYVAGKVLTKS